MTVETTDRRHIMGKMRDRIRAATVGKSPEGRSEIVEIAEGVKVKVRSITYRERMGIRDQCVEQEVDPETGDIHTHLDQRLFELHLMLNACVDPDDGEKVFEVGDFPDFDEQPSAGGGWFNTLRKKADELNSSGNSKTTPKG